MHRQFVAFQSHLDLAQRFWQDIVIPGDCVIDATCGNGHDTVVLSHLALTPTNGHVHAIDIQATALESTKILLQSQLSPSVRPRVTFELGCHAHLLAQTTVRPKLVVFNLGYLPGSDKTLTTTANTTWQGIQAAQSILMPGGAISITCYPGHPEGAVEEEFLLQEVAKLSPQQWSCSWHRWLNRAKAPSLLFLQKAIR